MLVCLQPLSQYKKKELYRHVETFELADPKLFEDAVITKNLCICTLKKDIADIFPVYLRDSKIHFARSTRKVSASNSLTS